MALDAATRWAEAGEKYCPRCYTVKPLSAFTVRQTGKRAGHPVSYCKACKVHRQKLAYKNGVYDRVTRPYLLKRKYGITREQYDEMFARQGGLCAICGTDNGASAKGTKTLAVDHCHETGEVRGLLCNGCNRAIGLLKDNVAVLESAIRYLKKGG